MLCLYAARFLTAQRKMNEAWLVKRESFRAELRITNHGDKLHSMHPKILTFILASDAEPHPAVNLAVKKEQLDAGR